MNKSYTVKYMYITYTDRTYCDDVNFRTETNARSFIDEIKNKNFIKKICYIYLTITEKVI